MAHVASNSIIIKDYSNIRSTEKVANAAITPGHLIELMSTDKWRVHNTAGGNVAVKAFALEDDLQGKKITEAYASAARVNAGIFRPGDVVQALLANGQSSAIGGLCESAGDGTLQNHTPDTWAENIGADSSAGVASGNILSNNVVGMYLEAVDMSVSSLADPTTARVNIMII